MSHHTIAMQDVRYDYPDHTQALQGVSFLVTHGESVALIGGNGAGKSTLLSLLVGIVFPTTGSVSVGGMVMTPKTAPDVRRRIGMVFQNPDDQLFMPTVFDDVAFGPLNLGFAAAETQGIVQAALETVGAAQLSKRSSHRLSTGEKRAVAIASVLSMTPDILLMDEPTSGLDPWSRRQLADLLRNFSHTRIIATHDLDFAMDVCDRTIVLQNGKIAADGPTGELLRDEALLASCRLELPLRLQKI
jgi:cobalt/nickel transport system ATP-binding protein